MPFLSDAYGFLRLAAGLKTFLREPISVEAAKDIVRKGMQTRDVAFLQKIERAIFANPRSPYLKLFRSAGCELDDVRNLVKREGVEETLQQFLKTGIYVTFDEFKGRTPAVRGSQTFTFHDTDFDNPLITTHYQSSSGGTRGRPTRVRVDLDHLCQSAPHWALWFAEHNCLANPLIFWISTHPGIANRQLMCAKFGQRFVKWFAPVGMATLKDRLISASVHSLIRWAAGFPKPEFVPLNEAWRVGEYLVDLVQDGMRPCLITAPSAAVGVSMAMQERGISLRNVTFLLGGEPLTSVRKETIEASQAKAFQTYGFAEGGGVGAQCAKPTSPDDVHIFLDAYIAIQHTRPLGDGETVNSLLLTALRTACPKIILNTEIGDYAVLEKRQCDCIFGEIGYHEHLHTIRSFQKLTGEGVTFIVADIYHLVEEVLPKKFGGKITDYQLIEEQTDQGLPHYNLLVSPAVGELDGKALVAEFLEELSKMKGSYRLMANMWAQADILHVKRQYPLSSARGKVLPFRKHGHR